jgi:hypothetical protein
MAVLEALPTCSEKPDARVATEGRRSRLGWHGNRPRSLAPMGVFIRAFEQFGVEITIDEARGPVGMAKREHIQAVINLPGVSNAWRARHGAAPTEVDVDRGYDVFVPLTVEVVSDYARLIDGVAEVVARLRARGLRIGSRSRLQQTGPRRHSPCRRGRLGSGRCARCDRECAGTWRAPLSCRRANVTRHGLGSGQWDGIETIPERIDVRSRSD